MRARIALLATLLLVTACAQQPDAGRPFAMGFTSWPYAFTDEAWAVTVAEVRAHGELITFHQDHGVPWWEAATGTAYDPNVETTLERQAAARSGFRWVYVSATPQNNDRRTLAGHWGARDHEPLPPEWAGRSFDDPEVISAYLNYLRRLVRTLEPDLLAYGIEVNAAYTPDDPRFAEFLAFCRKVYPVLKREFPDLTVFLTFQTDSWEVGRTDQLEVTRRLLPYTDLIALSTYPYVTPEAVRRGSAEGLPPEGWLDVWAALDPDKPLAVSETGFAAEDLVIPAYGFDVRATPGMQAAYVQRLLSDLERLKARFVVWWEVRDYDEGYAFLKEHGLDDPALLIWKDIGLEDGRGRPRPALEVWDAWRARPLRP
ncbi:hypothetical protein [Oceanithermus desulfurans]|uniref:Arabinogalactan endo-beta-1,4-galactanase n=2 Tax=Oceanithermus desulfurans TaxID=227924 RepID=A0A511RHY1_9DEIN|nr:hypothetical protein [Oceanithermus desulfurans]MBB6029119.1 hypothetical protein [Oceanithermus desulfurans]GEM89243.1 hypothetical protein ODE01S_06770 [Oceanithermus desulfurans NBRC 100063]